VSGQGNHAHYLSFAMARHFVLCTLHGLCMPFRKLPRASHERGKRKGDGGRRGLSSGALSLPGQNTKTPPKITNK
jgi:hypothetical protein